MPSWVSPRLTAPGNICRIFLRLGHIECGAFWGIGFEGVRRERLAFVVGFAAFSGKDGGGPAPDDVPDLTRIFVPTTITNEQLR